MAAMRRAIDKSVGRESAMLLLRRRRGACAHEELRRFPRSRRASIAIYAGMPPAQDVAFAFAAPNASSERRRDITRHAGKTLEGAAHRAESRASAVAPMPRTPITPAITGGNVMPIFDGGEVAFASLESSGLFVVGLLCRFTALMPGDKPREVLLKKIGFAGARGAWRAELRVDIAGHVDI